MARLEQIPVDGETTKNPEAKNSKVEKITDANIEGTEGKYLETEKSKKEAKEESKKIIEDSETEAQINMLKNIVSKFENDNEGKYSTLNKKYEELTKKIMKVYEKKLNEVLKSSENSGEHLDIQSLMNDETAANNLANEYMENQPQEVIEQTSAIKNVLERGTPEHKEALNYTINKMQKKIENLYKKIKKIDKKD